MLVNDNIKLILSIKKLKYLKYARTPKLITIDNIINIFE
ncbi:hypothetical protein NO004_550040 [Flavobacterium psychrophilum]|nr:hypothetical protein FI070_100017 [Flavobacterium psychrophilum]SNA72402.1 hypothetical protein FI146_190014 [Flavobacterium psychrophilum]SNA87445.1 hypothetical protein DK150_70002 [Flavobacterium psychrophilum]SNB01928.1 hypothetical protein FPC831_1860001 [Flavobacterium psychrophilum]SNB05963.1 hypothetical protein KU06112801_1470028 [Flavobacterium psychrophilum]